MSLFGWVTWRYYHAVNPITSFMLQFVLFSIVSHTGTHLLDISRVVNQLAEETGKLYDVHVTAAGDIISHLTTSATQPLRYSLVYIGFHADYRVIDSPPPTVGEKLDSREHRMVTKFDIFWYNDNICPTL